MPGYSRRPDAPAEVELTLRQESGFGCARCGHPYIEYHHIVPFSEEPHFRPEDMVALCGNCHPPVQKMGRDRQYAIKADAKNIRDGVMRGALDFDKSDLTFVVGGNLFTNTPVILRYRQTPIVSCTVQDSQAKISMNLFGPDGQTMLVIVDNDLTFRIDDLWDFEYKHNLVTARYGPRDIALRIDLRENAAKIEGKVWLGGHQVTLGPSQTTLPGRNRVIGCHFRGQAVGIQFGEGPSIGPTAIAVAE